MPVITFPFTSFTGTSLFLKLPARVFVILYNAPIFRGAAAVSASSARISMKPFLFACVCLFTSLSTSMYFACGGSPSRWQLVSFSFFFVAFLSSIVVHVSDLIFYLFSSVT